MKNFNIKYMNFDTEGNRNATAELEKMYFDQFGREAKGTFFKAVRRKSK